MDLFDAATSSPNLSPLADRFRPKHIGEFLAEPSVAKQLALLRRLPRLPSLILWGPPGVGKTSLARLLAMESKAFTVNKTAVDLSVKEIREIGEASHSRLRLSEQLTVLFIDEIHRLSFSQQDVLLPFVEQGDFILIGATTETPSYQIHKALLSRCRVLTIPPLSETSLKELAQRVFLDVKIPVSSVLSDEAFKLLVEQSQGDARRLLATLEFCLSLFQHRAELRSDKGKIEEDKGKIEEKEKLIFPLTAEQINLVYESQPIYFDKKGDKHYDTISAFIKSMRASESELAISHLAQMIEGGEDPLFIARRMIIFAAEDIGNKDPQALRMAIDAYDAVHRVGLPEGRIPLAQVTLYLCHAPKDRTSYTLIEEALAKVRRRP